MQRDAPWGWQQHPQAVSSKAATVCPQALDGAEQACILESFRLSQCFNPNGEGKIKISLWGSFSKELDEKK